MTRRKPSDPRNYVYETCYPDGNVFYVGMGVGGRAWSPSGRNRWYKNIVTKIRENGQEPLVRIFYTDSREEAAALEQAKILEYGRRDLGTGCLVNLHEGGYGGSFGRVWSEEARQKMRDKLKGRPGANLGRKWSEETKRKMGEASKGRWLTQQRRDEISSHMKGRLYSHETRDKMSESRKRVLERHAAGDFTRKRKYKYERAYERGEITLREAWAIHLERINNRDSRGSRSTWTCLPEITSE